MQTASKKVINGWAMYDWANSVYNLVITTTFFPIYFTAIVPEKVNFLGRTFVNSALYDYSLAAGYLVSALLYPILTSIADTRGNKKAFMRFFCYLGAAACSGLYLFKEQEDVGLGVTLAALAAVGWCGSLVFYNSYLPEIAAEQDRDRISARGFSFGYIGSVICQLIGFGLILAMPQSTGEASRLTFLLVGLWWFGFAHITFARLPQSVPSVDQHEKSFLTEGFHEMKKVFHQVTKMPVLKRFLRAFFFYSMGVQTVMLAATMFGSKLLGLDTTKLIVTAVAIQLVAIPGAWGMARLSMRFGNLRVLMGVVVFWIIICVAGYYTAELKEEGVNPEYHFYALAVAVGLVMGGIQALSRSTFAKLMPETRDTASFFSYYDFTEKIAIVVGIFTFGYIDELTHDHGGMKNSVLSLMVFFAIGLIWLYSALYKQNKLKLVTV